eukprot:Skav224087  [mRNA]  locus=scaffold942:450365:450655:+ [translate_table: standard]
MPPCSRYDAWSMSTDVNPIAARGAMAFYKGIAPRLMKISIGQAITFTAYEATGAWVVMGHHGSSWVPGDHTENGRRVVGGRKMERLLAEFAYLWRG